MAAIATVLDVPKASDTMEDSYDISAVLLGESRSQPIRESLVHHSINGTFAIRKGPWKLILGKDSGGFSRE